MSNIEFNVVFIGVVTFLYITLFNRFFSMIFVLNFSTAGLNSTASISLLFLLPALMYPFVNSYQSISNNFLLLGTVTAILNVATFLPNAMLSAIIAGFGITGLTLLLISLSQLDSKTIATGFGFGLVIYFTITVMLTGITIYPTTFGRIVFVLINIFFVILTKIVTIPDSSVNGYHLYIYLASLIYIIFQISNPYIVVTWSVNSPTRIILAQSIFRNQLNLNVISGLYAIIGIFAVLLFIRLNDSYLMNFSSLGYAFIFLLSSLDLLFFHVLTPFMYFLNIISLLCLIQIPEVSSRIGVELIGYLILLLLLTFFQTLSGHWAFIPLVLHPVTHGFAGVYIFLMGILIVVRRIITDRRVTDE